MVSVPPLTAPSVGLKVSVTVQVPPEATVPWQVLLVILKLPVAETSLIVSTPAFWLVRVTVCVALVDPAGSANHLLVTSTVILRLAGFDHPVRNINMIGWDVDVVEKRLLHPPAVALLVGGRHGEIFIEIESDDPREVQSRFLVAADQLSIKSHGR